MRVVTKQGVTIIETEQRLDSMVGPKLREVVRDLAELEGLQLIVDMKQTQFIDSSGVGGLLSSLKLVMKAHGDIKIARPTPQALTLLRLTRLHRVFQIYDDIEDALKSFQK